MKSRSSRPAVACPAPRLLGRVLRAGVILSALAWTLSAQAAPAPSPRLDFAPEEMALARAVAGDPALAAFYGTQGLRPIFAGAESAARRAALNAAVQQAPAHGLSPARYGALADLPDDGAMAEAARARALSRYLGDLRAGMLTRPGAADPAIKRQPDRSGVPALIASFATAPDPAAVLANAAPRDPRYLALQAALAQRQALIAPEGTPRAPAGLWKPGATDPRLADLRARLSALGFPSTGPAEVYDDSLMAAVAAYQEAAGLKPDGIAGPRTIQRMNAGADRQTRAILIALERMRWMGDADLSGRHIWVNIPEFTARVKEGTETVFQTRVVVGKTDPDQQTPEFSDEMEHIVVNPRWNVPRSITTKEYLPRLQANPNAVAHLDIVDSRGRVVPRGNINFGKYTANNFPYRMRQQPSDDNALGLVKFIFPNRWNIYLHDTPTKHLFNETVRAYSHGCVRVGDPFDLARVLLSQQTDNPEGVFRRALDSGRETFLELKPHVPVHLVYFTAFPDVDGKIRFLSDVYGRDARVWAAMEKAAADAPAGLVMTAQND